MKEWQRDQIEQAAAGAIDKTLNEWPYLWQALSEIGFRLPGGTLATTVSKICKLILLEQEAIAEKAGNGKPS